MNFALLTEAFSGRVEVAYMVAGLFFILGLKRLSGVRTSRTGNQLAAAAMLLAVVATLAVLWGGISIWLLILGIGVGGAIGYLLATRVEMTGMPELVALFNGLGGAASVFVALAEVGRFVGSRGSWSVDSEPQLAGYLILPEGGGTLGGTSYALAIVLSILIGAVTLSGSLIAWAKLSGKLNSARIGPIGEKGLNVILLLAVLGLAGYTAFGTGDLGGIGLASFGLMACALLLGVGLVVPIGGADMPVVISLLNSYSGLAAAATGFVLGNNLLILAGSLVGASGLILTRIMCKAMNRSLANVLFGGLGSDEATKDDSGYTSVKSATAEDLAPIFDAAASVVIVPGYGLAVAQAQHKVRELASLLSANDCEVRYAIHPVAGRMPGHMNVLLAEADVPYEELFE
ncbi:MAG: NAD(P)(+) transhydrogenase (Re/Si-specific) subunit beta, partial [Planctomycetota bacterium]